MVSWLIAGLHFDCCSLLAAFGESFDVNLLHKVLHKFIDVFVFFGGGVIVLHIIFSSEFLGLWFKDHSLFFKINFVAYQDFGNIFIGVVIDAFKPLLHIAERVFVCHIEANDDSVGLLVERVGQSSEALLARCVPDFDCDWIGLALGSVLLTDVIQSERSHV